MWSGRGVCCPEASEVTVLATLYRATALVVVGSFLGGVSHWMRFGSPFVQPRQPQICEAPEDVGPLATIPASVAADLCVDSTVVVVDVRPAEAFAAGHVAGAYHLPCSAGVIHNDLSDRLETARTILVYGESSMDATPVVESLLRRHLADVRFIAGGYAAWEAAGEACVSGPCAGCSGGHL